MGCIYNTLCSSLVALFLWQQVTHLAAVMAHCGISPSRDRSLSNLDLFFEFFLGLCNLREICVSNMVILYTWQEVRKCSSDSTSFCGKCAHSLSSLESQVCLWRPFSIAKPSSLSLYFRSVTVIRYSASV